MFRTFLHYCKRIVIFLNKIVLTIIPKNKKLILFSAWFGKKYGDSSMYMYEYLLKSNHKCYWYTLDKSIYKELFNKQMPVVYGKSLRGIWLQLRAKMLVSSVQFADFSHLFLVRCIYFDLDHGFPIKQSGFEMKDTTKRTISYFKLLKFGIHYYATASSKFVKDIVQRCWKLPINFIVKCNKPRTDVFFDEQLRYGKNVIVEEIKKGRKAIIYMPTQRSCGQVPIKIEEIFDLKKLNSFCVEHNLVFIIKKHFYHRNERIDLSDYSNIFDITSNDIETQTLLYQTDLLISDYSACYIDYLLLDRPIILYAYDLQNFLKNERKLYLSFEDNNCGFKASSFEQVFNQLASIVCNNWDDGLLKGRKRIRELYFSNNLKTGHAREEIAQIMDELIAKKYDPKWEAEL